MFKIILIFFAVINLNHELSFNYQNQLDVIKFINNVHEQQQAFEYFYQHTFRPDLLETDITLYSQSQLRNIVDSFYDITFFIQNKTITGEHLKYFDALRKNEWVSEKHYQNMFGVLLKSRMIEQAKEFHKNNHQFDLPDWININNDLSSDLSKINILSIDQSEENTLTHESFEFSNTYEIFISAHPNCHFTVRALNEIKSDELLTTFLTNESTWLLAPSIKWDFSEVTEWNRTNPEFELKYVYETKDFPMINYWGTPSFYFLKNGVVVDEVIGWPKEGKIKELKQLIKKHFSVDLIPAVD